MSKFTAERLQEIEERVDYNYKTAAVSWVLVVALWLAFTADIGWKIYNSGPPEPLVELKLTKVHLFDGHTYSFMIGRTEDGRIYRKQYSPIAEEGEIVRVKLSNGWVQQ